jgi:hypothetical protein
MFFDFDFELAKKVAQELPPSQKQQKRAQCPVNRGSWLRRQPLLFRLAAFCNAAVLPLLSR